jgi:hypothetical protein
MTLLLFGMCKQSGIKSHNNLAYNLKQTGPYSFTIEFKYATDAGIIECGLPTCGDLGKR